MTRRRRLLVKIRLSPWRQARQMRNRSGRAIVRQIKASRGRPGPELWAELGDLKEGP